MGDLASYADRFESVRFERREGILQMSLHTNGGSLRWSGAVVDELQRAFAAVGDDRENHVVILTGTGEEFSGPRAGPEHFPVATQAADRVLSLPFYPDMLEADVEYVAKTLARLVRQAMR